MFRKLTPYIRGYEKKAVAGPLFMVLEVVCELILPLLMANIINLASPAGPALATSWSRAG